MYLTFVSGHGHIMAATMALGGWVPIFLEKVTKPLQNKHFYCSLGNNITEILEKPLKTNRKRNFCIFPRE